MTETASKRKRFVITVRRGYRILERSSHDHYNEALKMVELLEQRYNPSTDLIELKDNQPFAPK